MKKLADKIKIILTDKKGESLAESMASVLVFSILMAAIATMVITSLRMTAYSTERATEMQNIANDVVFENGYDDTGITLNLVSRDADDEIDDVINVRIDVKVPSGSSFTAFAPKESP